jgi:hypothetical protein
MNITLISKDLAFRGLVQLKYIKWILLYLLRMTAKCPTCKSTITETGWGTEELDIDHHSGIRGRIIYCNKCQAILGIFQM